MLLQKMPAHSIPDNTYFWRKDWPAMWLKVGEDYAINLADSGPVIPLDFMDEEVLEYPDDAYSELTDETREQIRKWTGNPNVHF